MKHKHSVPPSELIPPCATSHIQHESGYNGLVSLTARPDEDAHRDGIVVKADDPEFGIVEYVDVLAISCTRTRSYFHRRARRDTMEKLVELFGSELRWFEEYDEKKYFLAELWP